MHKLLPFILLFSFCFSQDSTSVEQKLGEVGKMRIDEQLGELTKLRLDVQNTIITVTSQIEMAKSQIAVSQEDLGRIDYAEFILEKLFDPPEPEIDPMYNFDKAIREAEKDEDVEAEKDEDVEAEDSINE